MSGELTVLSSSEDGLARQASAAIAKLQTANVEEAQEILRDATDLGDLLRRRGWALDALNPLAEVKVSAERRIGAERLKVPRLQTAFDWEQAKRLADEGMQRKEIARRLGCTPSALRYAERLNWQRQYEGPDLATFDSTVGITRQRGRFWQRLASLTDEQFASIIKSIQDDDEEITTTRVLYRAGVETGRRVKKIEQGIYLRADGRMMITYKRLGRIHRQTLDTKNVDVARRTLVEKRGDGQVGKRVSQGTARLDAAYSDLRKCLARCDQLLPIVEPSARAAVERAISHGHRCEYEIQEALNHERASVAKKRRAA
jgi:hypothetical protein